jgi:hypothetical protein
MNTTQIEVFKGLLNDKNFKGKEDLKHLLWLNTTEPKFKVGDKVCGAEVEKVYSQRLLNDWCYKLKANGVETIYKKESDLI